jgi:hypothetical protein
VILSKKNIENARTICNYIIAEQTEINIKDSTKEKSRSLYGYQITFKTKNPSKI